MSNEIVISVSGNTTNNVNTNSSKKKKSSSPITTTTIIKTVQIRYPQYMFGMQLRVEN